MNRSKKILIAGGSGFVGRYISDSLSERGFQIYWLSRSRKHNKFPVYHWDPARQLIDEKAVTGKDIIINLSGAGIGDRLWTAKRKKIIYRSRIESTALLVNEILENSYSPSLFINASAIGYYGNRPGEILTEDSIPGEGFVVKVCVDWEDQVAKLTRTGIPTAILRTGIVLGKKGGSLPKFVTPVQLGFNILFSSGRQKLPWIHLQDLQNIMIQLINSNLEPGIYNAVAPVSISQREMNSAIATVLQKKVVRFSVPNALLHLLFREMTTIFTADMNVVPENLLIQGFHFEYPEIPKALSNILGPDKGF